MLRAALLVLLAACAGRHRAPPEPLEDPPVKEIPPDDEVRAIFAVRGGWGSARILPLLDWDSIRAHPKLLIGYSDITALHLAFAAHG